MKPFCCPYCKADLRGVHEEVMRSAPQADRFLVLCIACGEPVVIVDKGFRVPTFEELEELVAQPGYHDSRKAWMEMKRRREIGEPLHAETMWEKFRTHAMADVTDRAQLNYSKQCFMSGVAMAMAYFRYIGGMGEEEFATRLMLIEAELEAYKEIIEENARQRMN